MRQEAKIMLYRKRDRKVRECYTDRIVKQEGERMLNRKRDRKVREC